jgi:hypothetical protein
MKYPLFLISLLISATGFSQNLQVHYDFRHSLDPKLNPVNFPTFTFEYFKNIDTLETGSFLFKIQADMKGKDRNMGQIFTQLSQTLRFWKPKVYLSITYTGGLGVTPDSYGFYLNNSFGLGVSYPFQWKGAFLSASVSYRLNIYEKLSHDPQIIFYFGKGLFNYKIWVAGSIVSWTENRNQGIDYTKDLKGKKFAFFGDPQIWFKVKNGFSVGSRINLYYHLLSNDNRLLVYPTIGTKYQF